jgi:hypothetical protein
LAAEKFGQDLGLFVGVADQLAELEPQHSKLIKEYIQISDRLAYCEKTPPAQDDTQQPPPSSEPKPEEPATEIEETYPEEIPVTETEEETSEPEETPPSEEQPKKTYGLACRIQDLKAPGTSQRLNELKQLHEAHMQSIAKAQAALGNWQNAIEKMKAANEGSDAQREAEFPQFEQAHDQFLIDSAKHGFDSLEFMQETDECPDRLQIKMDQVRAYYN